ncbi:redox-regulated ATPase YchF [Candidatus Methanocrinis natronophilus]|uniref:Redox-regulated ATPase YchF n=1 Tax=Candidatus Methanocrinis natronophilus TaxID=3033396 RepID=A0ABT5X5G5_9EURY|nr:redox-regulated ATPase YchF [Candidatus Methanocrinis natronophilus]MDF0589939.1 redox-regulated ATPase YchF [Candidatus Methanocrinis natronophilus]
MLSVGLAGKPNAGKSTFFKAATLAEVEIANYPFTTIDANHGVSYVRVPCPCRELATECDRCRDGVRYVPVELIDVAGLVPDAHLGKGLGNEFLDSLRVAEAVIHVLDASGSADAEGNPVGVGNHDPLADVEFLKREIGMWLFGILNRNWERLMRRVRAEDIKVEPLITEQLAGAGVADHHVRWALATMKSEPSRWDEEEMKRFAGLLRDASKPMIIAANKVDVAPPKFVARLQALKEIVVPTSAAAEVALRMADKSGAIRYRPGDADFEMVKDLSGPQKAGLEKIRGILKATGGTGVQECLDRAVFELLEYIPVFPVEDEGKWTDRNGVVLPDAYLMKKGSTTKDLAYRIHTEIGESFLFALDGRSKRRLGEKHELKAGDVIKIVSTK